MISINTERTNSRQTRLVDALAAGDESTRLKAALAIGSNPEPGLLDSLIARCAIEPDFYVRDAYKGPLASSENPRDRLKRA
jgi:hypothetical protein